MSLTYEISNNYKYKIDMSNFIIPHDKNRNYNIQDENYIPPYFNYRYKSIYEGVILEIHLVDHCNLNCACCNHFSPIAEPWYISEEELRNSLIAAKENIPTIKYLILIGGEPTLHPKLIELCKIAREIFPNKDYTDIHVFTNGKNLKNIQEIEKEFSKLDILMSVCYYPEQTTISPEEVQSLQSFDFNNTRGFMNQTLVDIEGRGNYIDNFFNCGKQQLPRLFLDGYKLFLCPFHSQAKHYFKKANLEYPLSNEDWIDIRSLNNDLDKLQDFIFTPKPFCKYCYRGGENLIWHKSFKDLKEFDTEFHTLFFEDYDRYEKILNANKESFLICADREKNPMYAAMTYSPFDFNKYENRYNGKIDIIIPYYHFSLDQFNQLYTSLAKQTIINDCCIYLISDNSPNEKEIFNLTKASYPITFFNLKTKERSGPGAARQKGIDNSFNEYVLFLDADDYFIKENALEELYNYINNTDYKVCSFLMHPDNEENINLNAYNPNGAKMNVLIKREVLKQVSFRPYYSAEDQLFLFQLRKVAKEDWLDIPRTFKHNFIAYGLRNNTTNLSSTFATFKDIDIINFSKLASMWYFLETTENINNYDCENALNDIMIYYNSQKKNDFLKSFIYLYGFYLYKHFPNILNENNFIASYLIDYMNNNFYITLKNKTIKNLESLIEYVKNYIIDYYGNNYTKNIAKDILDIISNTKWG